MFNTPAPGSFLSTSKSLTTPILQSICSQLLLILDYRDRLNAKHFLVTCLESVLDKG